jgi:hypothetical protein
LAGSVIAKTLVYPVDQWVTPADTKFKAQLLALDLFQFGNCQEGCGLLGLECPKTLYGFVPRDYSLSGPDAFKADMLRAADLFEEAGL